MAATFRGNDIELTPGRTARIRSVRPDINCSTGVTVTIETKQRLADAYGSAAASSLTDSGDIPVRAAGRYVRPTISIAAGTSWTYAKGIDFKAAPGAAR